MPKMRLLQVTRNLIQGLRLPDPDDRHGLAAAIRGRVKNFFMTMWLSFILATVPMHLMKKASIEHSSCPTFAIESTRDLCERCGYESVTQDVCSSHADCTGCHPDGCVYDSWSNGLSSVLARQEGKLDGSIRISWSCRSTALADSRHSGCISPVGGGEKARKRGRAYCGSRSGPGVLAVTQAGKPGKTKSKRQSIGITTKGHRASRDHQER